MSPSDERRLVILHASDAPEDIVRAADNARLVAERLPGVRTRVIVNGAALEGLASPDALELVPGVEIAACAIGLDRRGIDHGTLPDSVEIVPAAVVAIVAAQLEGALYVRI